MLVLSACGISFCFLLMNHSWGTSLSQEKFWEKMEASNGLVVFKIMFKCSAIKMAKFFKVLTKHELFSSKVGSPWYWLLILWKFPVWGLILCLSLIINKQSKTPPHKTLKIQDSQKHPKRPCLIFNQKWTYNVYLTSTCTENIQPFYLLQEFLVYFWLQTKSFLQSCFPSKNICLWLQNWIRSENIQEGRSVS